MTSSAPPSSCPSCGTRFADPSPDVCPECGQLLDPGAASLDLVTLDPVDRGVLTRDFVIFMVKLFLDGVKDVVLAPLAFAAFAFDLIRGTARTGRHFYAILRVGERFDRWLNLFGPNKDAPITGEGLMGASAAGADSLIGRFEQMLQSGELPEQYRGLLRQWGWVKEQPRPGGTSGTRIVRAPTPDGEPDATRGGPSEKPES